MRGSGTASTGIGLTELSYVPGAMFGAWCGLRIYDRLSDRQFLAAINLMLIASGFALLV